MEGLGQKRLGVGLTLLLLVGPLIVFVLLPLGFPPVIGNLMACPRVKEYAAQVHPEWRAQGHWAGYDLVGGRLLSLLLRRRREAESGMWRAGR